MEGSGLFLPVSGDIPEERELVGWFGNITVELAEGYLDDDGRRALEAYYHEAGILRRGKADFFRAHFGRPLAIALQHLFGRLPKPRILDLGCGMGTQALLFALLGADVVAVDLDEEALSILAARKAFYETRSGRKLAIETHCGDAFRLEFGEWGPYDAIWSLFAFNMMQPSRVLLNKILSHAAVKCRFAVMDGNRLHWGKGLRRKPFSPVPSLSPPEFAEEMAKRSFRVVGQYSGIGFPPMAWAVAPLGFLRVVEKRLDGRWWFPVSHLILAEKT